MKNRLLAIGALASVTLFGGLAFASVAEAGEYLPAGEYKNGSQTMRVTSDGEYRIPYVRQGTKYWRTGFVVHEGHEVCYSGDKNGNLWTVDNVGNGHCYQAAVRGNRVIINNLGSYKELGGVWTKK